MCRPLNTGASSAPAPVSGFGARMAAMLGLPWRGTPSPLAAASGPVESMNPNLNPDGASVIPDLKVIIERRALMQGNRNAAQAAAYRARHLILAKGR